MAQRVHLWKEFWLFVKQNKKWWIIPLMMIMLSIGMLIYFSGSSTTPFIYTLF